MQGKVHFVLLKRPVLIRDYLCFALLRRKYVQTDRRHGHRGCDANTTPVALNCDALSRASSLSTALVTGDKYERGKTENRRTKLRGGKRDRERKREREEHIRKRDAGHRSTATYSHLSHLKIRVERLYPLLLLRLDGYSVENAGSLKNMATITNF